MSDAFWLEVFWLVQFEAAAFSGSNEVSEELRRNLLGFDSKRLKRFPTEIRAQTEDALRASRRPREVYSLKSAMFSFYSHLMCI